MSLETLKKRVSAQTLAIDKLIGDPDLFSDCGSGYLSSWEAFRASLWGNGLASLEAQKEVGGDDEPLSDAAPAAGLVVKIPETLPHVWHLGSPRILVRSEYKEAERAALSANADGIEAFLVTGQPGIGSPPLTPSSAEPNLQSGKTVFLILLLMQRLALGLPTVLQVERDYAVLFHERGTTRFLLLNSISAYMRLNSADSSSRIWALVDSNNSLSDPAPMFHAGRPFFVVEAVPPRRPRFEWAKEVYFQHFYMKTWTFPEVLQACVAPPSGDSWCSCFFQSPIHRALTWRPLQRT
jgi:hypothetical protein